MAGYPAYTPPGGGVDGQSPPDGVPILFADWGLHHYDTNGAAPTAELNPADDLAAWESGGGPAFWGVPTSGTWRLLIHDEIDRTLTGVYVYDADAHTIERASDADTTAKLHQRHVIAKTNRERTSGGVATNPAWRPINTTIVARDASDTIGTAVFDCVETIDTETFVVLSTGFSERPGYRTVSNMVTATAVDGTATNLDVLFPVAGAGEASTPGAGDFTTITTLPVATVVSIFGEVDVLVPYGSNQGLYTLKASGPWTPIATLGGELVMVLAGTSFGQPSFWQGINDRGDSAVDPTAEPTSWWQFSVTPAGFRDRRTAALTAYTPGDATDWTDPDPTTVAAALDTLAAGGGAPAAHKTSHEDGGSDELALNASQITAGTLDIARIPDRPPLLLQVSGRYIRTGDRGGAAAPTSNRVFYLPIWIETACTVDRIGVFHEATTAGVGSVARVGIYTSSGGLPASKVMETTIATDTAAAFKVATISESLARGLHFLAVASQPASGSPTFSWGPPDIRCGSTADGTSIGAYFDSSTYSGTLPATAVVNTAVGTQPPLVYLRVA